MAVRRWAAWRHTTRARTLEDGVGDLLAAVRGQAVQHDGVGGGPVDQLVVDGEPLERRKADRPLLLLAHARPHVGVEHRGALGRLDGVVRQLHGATTPDPVGEGLQTGKLVGREGVAGRGGDAHLHPFEQRRLGQGAGHVVGVPDVGQGASVQAAERLPHGEHVRHRLAGVRGVGEEVDDRDVEAAPARAPPPCAGGRGGRRPGRTAPGGSTRACGPRPRPSRVRRGRPRRPGCRPGAPRGRPPPFRWSCACAPTASRRGGRRPAPPDASGADRAARARAPAPTHVGSRSSMSKRSGIGAVPRLLLVPARGHVGQDVGQDARTAVSISSPLTSRGGATRMASGRTGLTSRPRPERQRSDLLGDRCLELCGEQQPCPTHRDHARQASQP